MRCYYWTIEFWVVWKGNSSLLTCWDVSSEMPAYLGPLLYWSYQRNLHAILNNVTVDRKPFGMATNGCTTGCPPARWIQLAQMTSIHPAYVSILGVSGEMWMFQLPKFHNKEYQWCQYRDGFMYTTVFHQAAAPMPALSWLTWWADSLCLNYVSLVDMPNNWTSSQLILRSFAAWEQLFLPLQAV